MPEHRMNKVVTSIKKIVIDPQKSKYVKKTIGSINRYVRGKKYSRFQNYHHLLEDDSPDRKKYICEGPSDENCLTNRCEKLSNILTIDSGITMAQDEIQQVLNVKKISFSPEDNKIIHIERYETKCDITSEICVAHVAETPKYEKVILPKPICNSTPENKCEDQITSKTTVDPKNNKIVPQKYVVRIYETNKPMKVLLPKPTSTSPPQNRCQEPTKKVTNDNIAALKYVERKSSISKSKETLLPKQAFNSSLKNKYEGQQQLNEMTNEPEHNITPQICAHAPSKPKRIFFSKSLCSPNPENMYKQKEEKVIEASSSKYEKEQSLDENICSRSSNFISMDDTLMNLLNNQLFQECKRRPIYLSSSEVFPISLTDKELPVASIIQTESDKICRSDPKEEYDDKMFQDLKSERDKVCVRMAQTSNVLKVIKRSARRDWLDEILAEKMLLETDLKYTLLVDKIRDLGYSKTGTPHKNGTGTITLSNFEFELQPQGNKKSKYLEYYVVSLSHETELLMSEVKSPENNKLIFPEKFTFTDINSDFNIVVNIFCFKQKTTETFLYSVFGKKTTSCCPMSKIYYENVNINELEEKSVLKPSFKYCGEIILTKDHIGSSNFLLSKVSEDFKLLPGGNFSLHVDDVKLSSNLSGFLTLGVPNSHNEILFWERKWCALNGTNLLVYNYPSEEDFGRPEFFVTLENCSLPLTKNCLRTKTFLLNTKRASVIYDKHGVTMRKKDNSVKEKLFFTADNRVDFNLWTDELESSLTCLQDWKKLML